MRVEGGQWCTVPGYVTVSDLDNNVKISVNVTSDKEDHVSNGNHVPMDHGAGMSQRRTSQFECPKVIHGMGLAAQQVLVPL